jgi:hypothetical protein
MKHLLLLLILIVYLAQVSAETTRAKLGIDQSILLKDRNLTILGIDTKNDKVLACINGQRYILSEKLNIGDAYIELKNVKTDYVDLEFKVSCKKCSCIGDSCSNAACYSLCKSDNDCNDNNDKTRDACTGLPKTCQNLPVNGKQCNAGSDCNDGNKCTTDICSVSHACINKEIGGCLATEAIDNNKEIAQEAGINLTLILAFVLALFAFLSVIKRKFL